MSFRKPPGVATWLLNRLGHASVNPSLAGDLLEEFQSGRSRGWYWRQILIVIAKPAGPRPGLKLLFVAGGVLTLCAWFLEPAPGAVRLTLLLTGAIAVIAAGGIDSVFKSREARRQPYTTTDWLKGSPTPGGRPRSRLLRTWLWIAAWAASVAQLEFTLSHIRQFTAPFQIVVYYLLIGLELFHQPKTQVTALPSSREGTE